MAGSVIPGRHLVWAVHRLRALIAGDGRTLRGRASGDQAQAAFLEGGRGRQIRHRIGTVGVGEVKRSWGEGRS